MTTTGLKRFTGGSRSRVAAVAALVLVLGGCGGGEEAGGERARTISVPSSEAATEPDPEGDGDETLNEAQLQASLLTVADLPTGYTAAPESGDEEAESDDSGTTGATNECSDKFDDLGAAEGSEAASVEASFTSGLGVILEQTLESYEDEDQLQERFDNVVEILSECPSFSSTDPDGVTTDYSVAPLSFPKLGDDTVALAITGATPDFNVGVNIVVVRLGRNVMSVAQGGLTTDAAALEQAARAGLDKLAAAG